MQKIVPPPTEDLAWVIGPYQEPIARVTPGDTIQIATLDAFGNLIDSPDLNLPEIIQLPFVNPCTGPIYVEGAEPGDTLAVTIDAISITRDYAVSCLIPEFGGLCGTLFTRVLNEPLPQNIMLHQLNDTEMIYDPNLNILPIPVEPFYGTIGTSPSVEAISTLTPGFHGGNMDAADICPGNTVYLPVNVHGALLFVGDGHAAQGDGEVCGVAAEVPTNGTFTINLIKNKITSTPRVESDEYLMSIGSARPMEDAARIAFYDLVTWLATDYGFERLAAYQLCSQVAKVRLANMVDVQYSVVAKFPKRYLIRN